MILIDRFRDVAFRRAASPDAGSHFSEGIEGFPQLVLMFHLCHRQFGNCDQDQWSLFVVQERIVGFCGIFDAWAMRFPVSFRRVPTLGLGSDESIPVSPRIGQRCDSS